MTKRANRRQKGKGVLDLIEEATHLLRTAPMSSLAIYYLGAIPFVLGLLFFWADMSRSPDADRHLAEASLGMAGLFLWMKFWQALFARRMRAQMAGETPPRWTARRCGNVFVTQALLQPTGLFLIALSIPVPLLLPWVYAFYQNATALAGDEPGRAPGLLRSSWRQAILWPRQNILLLLILAGFGACVLVNWTAVCGFLPHLVRMLTGIESAFTRSPFSLFNSTFFAAMLGLTYLCVDPIVKTGYALRCFYGESLVSGEDLKSELNKLALAAQPAAAGLMLLLALAGAPAATAAGNPVPTPAPGAAAPALSTPELDRTIDRVIHQRKYLWRMPRERSVETESEKGVIARFLQKVLDLIRKWLRAAVDWLVEWIRRLFQHPRHTVDSGYGWIVALELLLYGLLAAAVIALALLLYHLWRGRQQRPAAIISQAIPTAPDPGDENVGADQLPEDGWTKLGRELLERGELRLATRAFYLATLANLAGRNLIRIARFKSNRDYEVELRRRAHSYPDLLPVFAENVSVLERVWYGMHALSRDKVDRFVANVERMKAAA